MKVNLDNDLYFFKLLSDGVFSITDSVVVNNKTNKIVGNNRNSRGYQIVAYYDGIKTHYINKHRLLWINSFGLISEGLIINHIDGNKQNNELSNLELVTEKQNNRHARDNGLLVPQIYPPKSERTLKFYTDKLATAKLTIEQSKQIFEETRVYYRGIDEDVAKKYGVSRRSVSNIRRGKSWFWNNKESS